MYSAWHLAAVLLAISIWDAESQTLCGVSEGEDAHIDGAEASIDALPWLALVEYKQEGKPNGSACGAALIHPRFVLTAAHCLFGRYLVSPPVNVRLGEYDTAQDIDCQRTGGGNFDCNYPPVIVPIKSYTVHSGYSPISKNRQNDIAIIELVEAATYTDFISPICLPTTDITKTTSYDRLNFTVGGWGSTNNDSFRSDVKRWTHLPFKSQTDCQSKYTGAYSVQLTERHLCAGGDDRREGCRDDLLDSPLTLRDAVSSAYEVHGISSFGGPGCGSDKPRVYTKVYDYLDWIRTQMRS